MKEEGRKVRIENEGQLRDGKQNRKGMKGVGRTGMIGSECQRRERRVRDGREERGG